MCLKESFFVTWQYALPADYHLSTFLSIKAICLFSQFRFASWLEPIPDVIGRKVVYTFDKLPIYHKG